MGTLQDGLRAAGLASEKQLREEEAMQAMRQDMEATLKAKPLKEKEKRLGILRETSSPATFREEARKLLVQYPELVQEILNIAHTRDMHKKKDKGGTKLIAHLYQVKEALRRNGLSDDDKKTLVAQLFPKK